ncbi:MAG: hypothetical protein JJT85_08605 [Chromatiales bacterium]|nr:hypothetical protein [Chromatiales bacterium]
MTLDELAGLPWLQPLARSIEHQIVSGRAPHALLIHGPAGVGRRTLARALARRLLPDIQRTGEADDGPAGGWTHPDLIVLQPEGEGKTIRVEQIRAMISSLQLTAHGAGRKLALLYPAERLGIAACNSLLKTLEEPPGSATMILVASSATRLPATVVSRCQRLRLLAPSGDMALSWLAARGGAGEDWSLLLEQAGGAPLRALELAQAGFGALAVELREDLRAISRGQASPVSVARRWQGQDPGLCLGWLYTQTAGLVRRRLENANPVKNAESSHAGGHRNVKDLLNFLDRVAGLIRLIERPVNVELQLADLLGFWTPQAAEKGDMR